MMENSGTITEHHSHKDGSSFRGPGGHSLRRRLLWMSSGIVLVFFTLVVLTEVYWFQNRYQQETKSNLEVARAIGMAFRQKVRDILQEEYAIGAARQELRPFHDKDFASYLKRLSRSYTAVSDFTVTDSSGLIIASSSPGLIGVSVADRQYFKGIAAGDTTVVSNYLQSKGNNQPGFVIGRGFYQATGELDFAVLAFVEAARLGTILNFQRQHGEFFTLFDRRGRLIYIDQSLDAITEEQREWRSHDPILRKALDGDEATGYFNAPIGAESRRIGARVPIQDIGWVAGSAITVQNFFRPFIIPYALILVISIALAILTLIIARRTVDAVTRSLGMVQGYVRNVAGGDFSVMSKTSGLTEFDALIIDTNSMAKQLRDREQRLRLFASVVENSSDFIGLATPELQPFFVNDAGKRMVGLDLDQDVSKTKLIDYFVPEDRPVIENDAIPALQKHQRWRREIRFRNFKTGEAIPTLWNVFAVKDANGYIIAWATISPDLTELRQTTIALSRSEEQFRQLADSMPQLVWTAKADGEVDYYNQKYREFGGISPGEDGVWKWGPVVHEDDLQPTVDAWNHAVETGETYQIEHRIRHVDGTFHWYLSRAYPVHDKAGRITRWYGTATNIDISKHTQAELEESQKRLTLLNQNLEDIVVKRTEQVRALSKALTLAEQRERKRFSYILHENLQQQLFGAKMLLRQHVRDHQAAQQVEEYDDVAEGLSILESALQTTKTLSVEMNPPILRTQGLDAALEWLADHMEKKYGLRVELHMEKSLAAIRNETQQMLTQMVRELLNNVRQHAGVYEATLVAGCGDNRLSISVSDSGQGFDVGETIREVAGETQLGIFSIRERLRLFNGDLIINSTVGEGTECILILPVEKC
ncbi:MAG: PAS domain-containing protein [Chitinivibrionales bacterium]